MSISSWSGVSLPWVSELARVKGLLAPLFARSEPREQAGLYLDGLLASVERKNGWQLAEHAGDPAPWRMQALLGRTVWDADRARDLCRGYALEQLGDAAGVRQYSGTAGRIENCQIGVFLSYASRHGHALIDRRLYLPKTWAENANRREAASVPEDVAFATKPQIAGEMIARALDAGVPCAWILGDAVYGGDKRLRVLLEERQTPYVLAIRSDERFEAAGFTTATAEALADAVAAPDWRRLPAGAGSKGPRLYDWARVRLFRLQSPPWDHWLLIRRSIAKPQERAYYVAYGPDTTELNDLAAVAGLRWTIEECFQSAKSEAGLDHCEARSWHGWHRHMTLSMLALAFLAGLRSRLQQARSGADAGKANKRSPSRA